MELFGPPTDPAFDPERRLPDKNDCYYEWSHPLAIDEESFSRLKDLCLLICKTGQYDRLGGGTGEQVGGPLFSDEAISFNRKDSKFTDTFYFPRISEDLFNVVELSVDSTFHRMCNTYSFPNYTATVGACLCAAVYLKVIDTFRCESEDAEGLELFEQAKLTYKE